MFCFNSADFREMISGMRPQGGRKPFKINLRVTARGVCRPFLVPLRRTVLSYAAHLQFVSWVGGNAEMRVKLRQ
jgi:hypothetical protein